MESLEEAKKRIHNAVWRDIYYALLRCRQNILSVNPEEYAAFPVNGEPDHTFKHCSIQQTWSRGLMLHHVLNKNGEIKEHYDVITPVRPILMEYLTMRAAMSKDIKYLKLFARLILKDC